MPTPELETDHNFRPAGQQVWVEDDALPSDRETIDQAIMRLFRTDRKGMAERCTRTIDGGDSLYWICGDITLSFGPMGSSCIFVKVPGS